MSALCSRRKESPSARGESELSKSEPWNVYRKRIFKRLIECREYILNTMEKIPEYKQQIIARRMNMVAEKYDLSSEPINKNRKYNKAQEIAENEN